MDDPAESDELLWADSISNFPPSAVEQLAPTEDRDGSTPVLPVRREVSEICSIVCESFEGFIGECEDVRELIKLFRDCSNMGL